MPKVIVNNLHVQYDKKGKGPSILFLHGWGQTGDTFQPMVDQLSAYYEVVTLDLPGFGKSQLPLAAWGVGEYVSFVTHFLEKIQCQPITMIGHSFGGRIIIKGARREFNTVQKLVLIGSAGVKPAKTKKQSTLELLSAFSKRIPGTGIIRRGFRARLASTDYLNAGPLQQIFLNTIKEDLQIYAQNIQQPTLLIWGAKDDQTPLTDAQQLHSIIPHSKLKVFENAGHFVYQEEYDEVRQTIEEFIA